MPRKKKSSHRLLKSTAIVGALASAFYLYGAQKARRNRNKIRGWMMRLKGDLLSKLEKIEEVDKSTFDAVLEKVRTRYSKLKEVNDKELSGLVADLKKHWQKVSKESRPRTRSKTKKTPRRVSEK